LNLVLHLKPVLDMFLVRFFIGGAMPVIVMASPKGGVGKSTCAVLLATEFARLGADVTVLDCDPNRSLTRWASHGLPERITLRSDIGRAEIVPTIRAADGDGKVVVVDLEGVASQLVSRAISQADLVIVPMQPTALDAEIGSEALALVREEEEALGRGIRHAVVLTKTSAAMKSRVQKELEVQLRGAGVDVIEPSLVARAAFAELFAYGGDLTRMMADPDMVTGGNVTKALENARQFAEAVYDRLG
jgi:chromosome partitioning protein